MLRTLHIFRDQKFKENSENWFIKHKQNSSHLSTMHAIINTLIDIPNLITTTIKNFTATRIFPPLKKAPSPLEMMVSIN